MPIITTAKVIFLALWVLFLDFFVLEVCPNAVSMVFFEAGLHGALVCCVWLGAETAGISDFFVILAFLEGYLWVVTGCHYVIMHKPTEHMYNLIPPNPLQRPIFPMTNNTPLVPQAPILTSLTYKLSQPLLNKRAINL